MAGIIVSQEKLKKLMDMEYRFYAFKNKLENMSDSVNKEYDELSKAVRDLFKEQNDFYDKEQERKSEIFDKIQDQYGFESIWSIDEVNDINDIFGFVKGIKYFDNSETVNKEVTYLELWKIAERLIALSGDHHHIFIENFSEHKESGFHELQTGS